MQNVNHLYIVDIFFDTIYNYNGEMYENNSRKI